VKNISQQFADNALKRKTDLTEVTNAAEIKKINQVLMALYNQNPDSVQIVLLSWLLFADLITGKNGEWRSFHPKYRAISGLTTRKFPEKKFRSSKSLRLIISITVFQNSYVLRYGDSGKAGSWPWSIETKKRMNFSHLNRDNWINVYQWSCL
jgi:hypothetical protein